MPPTGEEIGGADGVPGPATAPVSRRAAADEFQVEEAKNNRDRVRARLRNRV